MNIPFPEMGYWQKIQYGKPVEINELPIDFSGRKEVTLTIRENPISFNRSPQKRLKESLENDSNLPIKVNQKLAMKQRFSLVVQKAVQKIIAILPSQDSYQVIIQIVDFSPILFWS